MATLNTVFKKTFGEVLEEKGYVKVKGRQPYFARVVGGEIVQVITTRNEWCGEKEYKIFAIYGGMASLYRKEIDLTLSPSRNINWLVCVSDFYSKMNRMNMDNEYRIKLMRFPYKKDNDISLYNVMKTALAEAEKNMFGILDGVKNIEQYMEYLDIFDSPKLNIDEYDDEKGEFVGHDENEGFLYIMLDNHNDFKKEYEEELSRIAKEIEDGVKSREWQSVELAQKLLEESRLRHIQRRDYIYSHPNLHEQVLKELEQRKANNIERLRSCGVEV